MIGPLSIVLPVWNAERELSRLVTQSIATAAELTSRFEVLVLDEGSSDDTFELAGELARHYPQVKALRTPLRPRRYLICPIGLNHAQGELILYRPIDCQQPIERMSALCRHLDEFDLVIDSYHANHRGWLGMLERWWSDAPRFGLRLVRRETAIVLHHTRQPAAEAELPDWLDELGCRWCHTANERSIRGVMGRHETPRPKFMGPSSRSGRRTDARYS